jgi:peroxiredoxin Q/BCP
MQLSLTTSDQQELSLSRTQLLSRSDFTVLYFYPKDDTPGCSVEAADFAKTSKEFEKLSAQIMGVSKDSFKSHCSFIEKFGLPFDLVIDSEQVLHKKFETRGEKKMYGKTYHGTIRSTFIIDAEGNILKEWRNVSVPGHVASVLEALRELHSKNE